MKEIILNWAYFYDRILCPAFVADDLQYYQLEFDKWISNPENKHAYWEILDDGDRALCFDSDAFLNWLNEFIIKDNRKAYYIQKDIEQTSENKKFSLPVINF